MLTPAFRLAGCSKTFWNLFVKPFFSSPVDAQSLPHAAPTGHVAPFLGHYCAKRASSFLLLRQKKPQVAKNGSPAARPLRRRFARIATSRLRIAVFTLLRNRLDNQSVLQRDSSLYFFTTLAGAELKPALRAGPRPPAAEKTGRFFDALGLPRREILILTSHSPAERRAVAFCETARSSLAHAPQGRPR